MDANLIRLGERLRLSRTARGMTQSNLARAAGTTHATISRIESALQDPAATATSRIASALGVTTDYLLGLSDVSTPAEHLAPAMADIQQAADIVALRDVRAAAGWGASVDTEPVIGHVAFPRRWLRRHRLNPNHCSVIEIIGDSMEPLLEDGCWILVDHKRQALVAGRVFAVWTDEGLVVKRVDRSAEGWRLVSEDAGYVSLPLSSESRIVGEVKWAGSSV